MIKTIALASREALYVTIRDEWRDWLKKNHVDKENVWLVFCKKHSGKPSLPYDDAVEEALCFGWIDSQVNRVDEERYLQKFTPRKKNSTWSALNKKRVQKMVRLGRLTEAGLRAIEVAGSLYSVLFLSASTPVATPVPRSAALRATPDQNQTGRSPRRIAGGGGSGCGARGRVAGRAI